MYSVGPCSRHRKVTYLKNEFGSGAISEKHAICLKIISPTNLGNERCAKTFLHKLFEHSRGPGHHGKIPGTSQIPLFETQGRQTFEGGRELSATNSSRGRPPPHKAVSGPRKLIFVLFFLPEIQW